MKWTIITLIVFAVCVFLPIIYGKLRKRKLPNNIIQRVGAAAVAIQQRFITNGFHKSKEDKVIWNNIGFVIAYLIENDICTVVDQIHLQIGFRRMYKDDDEAFFCETWIRTSVAFYRKQLKVMKKGEHNNSNIIVYNLMNPSLDKATFENTTDFNTDILVASKFWAGILDIMDIFFLSDKNIKELPLGFKI